MTAGREFGFTIDMPVIRQWENITSVRSSLQTCVSLLFQDVDQVHDIAMVGGELLENAVKYGHWREGSVEIFRLRVWGTIGAEAHVEVSNPVDGDASAAPVFEVLARLEGASSPAAAFQERLLAIATSFAPVSQLGLLRIAYEGGCGLKARLASGILTITATIPGRA